MKKRFMLFVIMIALSGCAADKSGDVSPSGEPDITRDEIVQRTPASPETLEVSSSIEPTALPKLDDISIEYYFNNSSNAEPKTSDVYSIKDTDAIAQWYISSRGNPDDRILFDENGIPNGLSYIKIYELPDRDDLIVIVGERLGVGWPGCYMFTCKDGVMVPFPDLEHFEGGLYDGNAFAEEIHLVYGEGFPFPIIEVFLYSHRGNGSFHIYRLNGKRLEHLMGDAVTGCHYSTWEELREDPVFDDIGIKSGGYFSCHYENGHLSPCYEDINGDGYIDIVLQGNFQCVVEESPDEYKVLASQQVKDAFIYEELSNDYIYASSMSVRSPLEERWFPLKAMWRKEYKER